MQNAIEAVSTWDEFRRKWDSRQNFILRGEVFPFQYDAPALKPVIEALRHNEQTRILRDCGGLDVNLQIPYSEFRDLPLAEARHTRAKLAHFELRDFTGEGQVFQGLNDIFDSGMRHFETPTGPMVEVRTRSARCHYRCRDGYAARDFRIATINY
jgi:hypothetical protein